MHVKGDRVINVFSGLVGTVAVGGVCTVVDLDGGARVRSDFRAWRPISEEKQKPVKRESKNEPKLQLGKYRHYKGGMYRVMGVARHSETQEDMVIYQALYGDAQIWVRPLSIWTSPTDDGKVRFERIEGV